MSKIVVTIALVGLTLALIIGSIFPSMTEVKNTSKSATSVIKSVQTNIVPSN